MKRILMLALALCLTSHAMASRLYLRSTTDSITVDGDDAVARVLSETRGSSIVAYTKNTVNGPVGTLDATDQFTINTGDSDKISWASPSLAAMTVSGALTLQLTGSESSTTANSTLTAEVLRLSAVGAVLSVIAPAQRAHVELGTSTVIINWSSATSVTNLNSGDRIGIRVYVDDALGLTQSSGKVVTLRFNGPNPNVSGDSWLDIQQTISLVTVTPTLTATVSATPTQSITFTPTRTVTLTATPTGTFTFTPTWTQTATPTFTPTFTHTNIPDNVLRRSRLLVTLASATDSTSCANNQQLTPTSGNSLVITWIEARTTSATSHTLTVYGDNATCSGTILANFNALGVEVISGSSPDLGLDVGGQKLATNAALAFKTDANITNTDRVDIYGYELDASGAYVNP